MGVFLECLESHSNMEYLPQHPRKSAGRPCGSTTAVDLYYRLLFNNPRSCSQLAVQPSAVKLLTAPGAGDLPTPPVELWTRHLLIDFQACLQGNKTRKTDPEASDKNSQIRLRNYKTKLLWEVFVALILYEHLVL